MAQLATFDTHKYIKELTASGFDEKQAEVIIKSILEGRDYDISNLATKEQLENTKKELKQEIELTKSQLETRIEQVKNDMIKWLVGLFIPLYAGVAFLMIRLFFV